MSFFEKLSNNKPKSKGTTQNFFIGTPEAEGESTYNSRIKLGEIFGDYLNVFPELNSEKFIITGRKGAGKSAIAEYIYFNAGNDPNTFCDFIKTRDLDIHKIVQTGQECGLPIEEKLIFEWLILIKMTKLITENVKLEKSSSCKELKMFLKKNSGFIDIKDYEISEIVRDKAFQINIEYFKRAFSSIFKRQVGIKEHKAPFYKILRPLQEVIVELLSSQTDENSDEYILIFDDLDIEFKESDNKSIENLTNLLRVAKDYNIDLFGKSAINAKVIILLRDDLKRVVVKHNADTAKLFSSYEIPLVWYEHDRFKNNENSVALKKLINRRIEINFKKESLDFDNDDPWSSLIEDDYTYNGSSFKYVIDYTFFRPRDLILFFKPLPKNSFKIPLTAGNIESLVKSYVEEVMTELRNELSASFSSHDITKIFVCLKNMQHKQPLSSNTIVNEFKNMNLEYDAELALIHLFEYSILGNLEKAEFGTMIYFKHRERKEAPYVINFDLKFIFHHAVQEYFDRRKAL